MSMKVMANEMNKEDFKSMVLTKEQKERAILEQSVAFLIDADVVYDTKTKTEEEIFGSDSIRNQPDKLTGSQIGVAMGLSSFQTPLKLWREKRGIDEVVNEDKEVFRAGHAIEDFVAKMFARKLKEEYGENLESVDIINDTNMYQSRKFKWAIGQPDRFAIITFKSGKIMLVGLECKSCYNKPSIDAWKESSFVCPTFYEESGELERPATYDCQCRDYMMVTALDSWYICCCWGFMIDQCAISLVRYDAEKEALLNSSAEAFIDCCVNGFEPVMCEENQKAVSEYLNNKYDLSKADTVEMDESYDDLIKEAVALSDEAADLKKKAAENEKKQQDLAKRLLEKSDGKGTYFSYKNDEKSYGITISVPKYANSIDIDGIKKECPDIYSKMAEIGIYKVTKTDLEKIDVNGKKFDATPFVIQGAVNMTKPVKIGKVTVKDILTT